MRKKKSLPLTIGIIILVLGVLGAGFLVYKDFKTRYGGQEDSIPGNDLQDVAELSEGEEYIPAWVPFAINNSPELELEGFLFERTKVETASVREAAESGDNESRIVGRIKEKAPHYPLEQIPLIQPDMLVSADERIVGDDISVGVTYYTKSTVDEALPTVLMRVFLSDEDITYEEGEIWPYPGSAMFKPKTRKVYSRDMKEEISSSKPLDYTVHITYYTGSDRINYQNFGMLIRVRNPNVLGVWSSVGSLPMPDVEKDSDIPAGTWYEFKKGGSETDAKASAGFSAAYTFTRIISDNDSNLVIDKGTAIMMPVGDHDIVELSDAGSDTGVKSFTDEDYMFGEKLLQVEYKEKMVDDKEVPVFINYCR
ncbi:MAG: hypothetical protein ACOYIF_12020 [Acetivibrionales bacterium]